MMRVTLDPQEELKAWAEPRFGIEDCRLPAETVALGVMDAQGGIHAVVCLNAFYGHYASIHIASDGRKSWASPQVLRCIFGYAFNFLGLRRLNCITSVNNLPAQILALRLGFEFEGRTRCGADDGSDGIVLGMLAENCRWIDGGFSHGKECAEG